MTGNNLIGEAERKRYFLGHFVDIKWVFDL